MAVVVLYSNKVDVSKVVLPMGPSVTPVFSWVASWDVIGSDEWTEESIGSAVCIMCAKGIFILPIVPASIVPAPPLGSFSSRFFIWASVAPTGTSMPRDRRERVKSLLVLVELAIFIGNSTSEL